MQSFAAGRYYVRLAVFALAAVMAAAALGASLGSVGPLLSGAPNPAVAVWLLVALLLLYATADLRGHHLWVPSSKWQVPQAWARFGAVPFAGLFGAALGLGFLTEVNYIGYYALLAVCVASGSASAGALILGVFGAVRGAPLLLMAARAEARGCRCGLNEVAQFNRAVYLRRRFVSHARAVALLGQAAVLIAGVVPA